MSRLIVAGVLALAGVLPIAAQAEGSRMPAGGNLMSSYVDHPNHDPGSLWSQRAGTGQILGQPMFSENTGAQNLSRRRAGAPHWATGSMPSRRVR